MLCNAKHRSCCSSSMARRVKWFTTPSLAMEGEEDKEVEEEEEGEKKKEGGLH